MDKLHGGGNLDQVETGNLPVETWVRFPAVVSTQVSSQQET